MTKQTIITRAVITLTLLFTSILAHAASEINTGRIGNTAIKGYDPVAYFKEDRAVKGSRDFEYEWKGATWRFSSQENLDDFVASPDDYAPQYGGYCAYAVSQNDLAGIDPDQFTILDGKLYLNFNKRINIKWTANRNQYIIDANNNWPSVINK